MYTYFTFKKAYHPRSLPEYNCPFTARDLQNLFSHCADFQSRRIKLGLANKISATLFWIDGTVQGDEISNSVLRPLTQFLRVGGVAKEDDAVELLLSGAVYCCSVQKKTTMDDLVFSLTHGHCVLFFDTISVALSFELPSSKMRSVSEPTLEKTLKGAKDSFVENLRTNTFLVRRRISSPQLKLIESTVGRKSHTKVSLFYVDGVAAPFYVEEFAKRLDGLDIDALLALGVLEETLSDHPYSPFPQLLHTERIDRFAMYLMDGRVGLLVDGIPVGLVAPVTFAEFMKVTGDSNMHFLVSTGVTCLRYLSFLISTLLPALYVAVAMYHQELIPTKLLLSVIEAKQNVPFSTAIEILGMMLSFSLLQEAGLRLPSPIGDTVSIIGALIVGQSAVDARIISPIAIIVVAVSGIAAYTLPSQDMGYAVRLLRFTLVLCAIGAGLYGVVLFLCLLLLHLSSMDSFGMNYTSPLSDGASFGLFRLLIRIPKLDNKYRDPHLHTPDERRQK